MRHKTIYFCLAIVLSTTLTFSQQGIISSEILIQNDSIALPGTLTYNTNAIVQPLVIFVHGSGPVNRDGNSGALASPSYIQQLSDSLTKRGIAFYRYDKRSATAKNLPYMMKNMSFDPFVTDLNVVVDHFKDDKKFTSITLIGHSQGSLVAMLADQTYVNQFISLAGPSQSVDHSVIAQVKLQNGDSISNIVKSHFKELSQTGSITNVDPNLMALFNPPMQPFWKSWMSYNPSEEIKKLKVPILIINGDKDLQVYVNDAQQLHEANPNSTIVIIKNMNHVLKTIEKDSDNLASYSSPDFPISAELLDTIETFIKE